MTMQQRFWKAIPRWITVIAYLALLACAVQPVSPDTRFTVLFFNDLHGHLRPVAASHDKDAATVGGIARMAALVKAIRTENEKDGYATVLLVAGDILQGTPMSTTFKGAADIDCLNQMGVDAVTIGNHEFDFGLENFRTLQHQADFPFLSANVVYRRDGRRLGEAFHHIPLNDRVQLTVIGVTTRTLSTTTSPEKVAALNVLPPTESVTSVYRRLPPGGPVILLSHCRHRTDRNIAAALPGLAAIIAGHDQILFDPHRVVGGVPIFQAFEKGRYLGRLDFVVDGKTGQTRMLDATYLAIDATIADDPTVAGIVDSYARQLDERFNEIIGRANGFLDGERENIRWQETALGNFVTDVMRQHTGADIALINAGSLRASIAPGDITVADVFTAMPYANELVSIDLTGRQLLAVLQRAVQGAREDEDGGFLHVSGITFTIDGRSVRHAFLLPGREAIDPDRHYRVAITDFLYAGGDGYALFKRCPAVLTGLPLRELLVETIRQQPAVNARIEGRIQRRGIP